jgi:hypothetical protein
MNHPYRLIRPEELPAPGEMEPAVVLRVSLETVANVVAENVGKKGANVIFHASDSDAMYLQVRDVPLAFVSFNEEPCEVHVYVAQRHVRGQGHFLQLLGRLPLADIEGHWWTRADQPHWLGNGAGTFVIGHGDRGRRSWT